MSCQRLNELLDAYVDGELDLITHSELDRHLGECGDCRARVDQYTLMHRLVGAQVEYFKAPEGFEQKLREGLYSSERKQDKASWRGFPQWRTWGMTAAGIATVLLLTAALLQLLRRSPTSEMLAQQVVASHIRSLQANHLNDVISSDQHTVKPWFNGRLDFAPVVRDLAPQGFPLVGGRLDYLNDRAVAALVYKRRQHTINLFLWPSQSSDSGPVSLNIRGYDVLYWAHAHMGYWAVSDLNATELNEFARDFER